MIEHLAACFGIAGVAALSYYAGWRAAASYLHAAQAVSSLTNAVAKQANDLSADLIRSTAATEAVAVELARNTEGLNATKRDLEISLHELYIGMERAGLVRGGAQRPRQVGEGDSA